MVEYIVEDALEYLRGLPSKTVDFAHLDDAWARPQRSGGFGVNYRTHPFDEDDADLVEGEPGVDTNLTVVEFLDAVYDALQPGGFLALDTDSYLISRAGSYFEKVWPGRCQFTYTVTSLTSDGVPDRSTPGMYGSSGGYTILIAQKEATPVPQSHPVGGRHTRGCPCERERRDWEWGTVKPLAPYLDLIQEYTSPDSRIIEPCAGTAPAVIAAEREYGTDVDATAIDIEPDAKRAYERRREEELPRQTGIGEWGK